MLTVEEFMTAEPVALSPYQSMADVRRLMNENHIRHIPVVESERLVGLVSHRDLLGRGISSQDVADPAELADIESGTLVAEIMARELVTATADMRIDHAARLIHRKKIGCLPVIDENRRLVGIITDYDFVTITIQLLEMMAEVEPTEED